MKRFYGWNLKYLRLKHEESIEELSNVVDVDHETLFGWENDNGSPNEEQVKLLTAHYEVDPHHFYKDHYEHLKVNPSHFYKNHYELLNDCVCSLQKHFGDYNIYKEESAAFDEACLILIQECIDVVAKGEKFNIKTLASNFPTPNEKYRSKLYEPVLG